MRNVPSSRLLPVLALLAAGFALGSTFALAGDGDSITIDVDEVDRVIDVTGTVVVVDGQGYVEFSEDGTDTTRVQVRGWDAFAKRGILGEGTPVRVTGVSLDGKKQRHRGHVTLLK